MQRALLISDLHLSAERPAANEALFAFLEERVPGAQALYILGDLFEYWVGDDDLVEPFHAIVAGFLRRTSAQGTSIWLMHGNRDFLLGERFASAAGAQLLADPSVVDLCGTPTLLMHGDTLCTGDSAYQAWRQTCRSQAWQQAFLERPLEQRREDMLALRARSEAGKREKSAAVMDVESEAVVAAMRSHGVLRLVHGHTHRPAKHELTIDDRPAERWVLPDWYSQGGALEATPAGLKVLKLPFA